MTRPAIMIVDDDPEITSALARGLRMHGYDIVPTSTLRDAAAAFPDPTVKAAIIDVMIGQDSGIELVAQMRAAGHTKPILMLSALTEVEDRAAGLAAGADDYVVKPFSFDELVARLQVQLQRVAGLHAKPCQLDPVSRTVRSPSQTANLTEREYDLLAMLHDNVGIVMSRGDIFDRLWAREGTSSENIVDVYIGYLRKKLDPASGFEMRIKTVRNRGFVLEFLI